MSLIHLIYCSAASNPQMGESALNSILAQSRDNNSHVGITGILLFEGGTFFQVLEGEEAVVDAVYTKILADPRHVNATKIISEPILRRDFGEWTMGYPRIEREEMAEVPGINDFFDQGHTFLDLGEGRAKALLAHFTTGRWRVRPSREWQGAPD